MEKEIIDYYLEEFNDQEDRYKKIDYFFESSNLYLSYHPKNWIKDNDYEKYFTNILKELLQHVDNKKTTYGEIHYFTRFVYYYSLLYENIVVWELDSSKAFKDLFNDCYNQIFHVGGSLCDTSRKRIDLLIEVILTPEKIIDKFKILNEYDEEFKRVSSAINHPEVSNYLIRILKKENKDISSILYYLEYQKLKLELQDLKKYLYPMNNDSYIQYCTINYIKSYDSDIALILLEKLKKSDKLYQDNYSLVDMIICHLKYKEDGLIKLFKTTSDSEMKYQIILLFDSYKSSKFIELLVFILNDDTCESYIRNRAYDILSQNFTKIWGITNKYTKDLILSYSYK
jgi:hypothetical protein